MRACERYDRLERINLRIYEPAISSVSMNTKIAGRPRKGSGTDSSDEKSPSQFRLTRQCAIIKNDDGTIRSARSAKLTNLNVAPEERQRGHSSIPTGVIPKHDDAGSTLGTMGDNGVT